MLCYAVSIKCAPISGDCMPFGVEKLTRMRSMAAIIAIAVFLLSPTAYSANWLGTTTSWTTAGNWSSGSVPIATTDVYVDTTQYPVISASGAVAKVAYLANTATGNLTISGGGTLSNTVGFIGYNANLFSTATVTGSGSLWTMSGDNYVGVYGNGILNVLDGAGVRSGNDTSIGRGTGSTGTLNVLGASSTYYSTNSMHIGYYGPGNLNVSNGGAVSVGNDIWLGFFASATGTANISGSGSSMTATDEIFVGLSGKAFLTVSDGAHVGSKAGYISHGTGSYGTVTITGTGSNWTNTQVLEIGVSSTGTLNILNSASVSNTTGYIGYSGGVVGTVNVTGTGSTWTNSASLIVGCYGSTGYLTIANGGKTTNTIGYIGYGSSATGTVTVTGAGSTWTNSSDLYIANDGRGTVNVENGGSVTSVYGYIGYSAAKIGDVTVTGAGSNWTASNPIIVGRYGLGTLSVANGAGVRSGSSISIGYYANSTGTLNILGASSTVYSTSDTYVGRSGTGTLSISSGGAFTTPGHTFLGYNAGSLGTVTVSDANSVLTSNRVYVGNTGTGSITVSNGGEIHSAESYVGAGGYGTVTVTGTGSKWIDSQELQIGSSGTGVLNISNAASVSNTTGRIGHNAGRTGTVNVTGTGSTWTNTSSLLVGYLGNGTLNISNGANVSDVSGYVAYDTNSTGVVNLTDSGSLWSNSNAINVGYNGTNATLNISNGADLTASSYVFIGTNALSNGTINLTGTGSTITTANFQIGSSGNGTLNISDGGVFTTSSIGYIAASANTTGNVTVTGAGSRLANATLYLGYSATGAITISNGGSVTDTTGYLGYNSGSYGSMIMTGSGSTWSSTGKSYIGYSGKGSLTLSDEAEISSGDTLNIASNAGSTGALNIGAAQGSSATAPGTVDSDSIVFGAGTGSILFNHTSTGYTFASDISGAGTISAIAGTTYLTGDLSSFTGNASSTSGATLSINGTMGGTMSVGSGSTLKGTGTIGDTTINSGATVAPGNSIGTLHIAGDLTFALGSTYDVELNAAGQSDKIEATGAVTINGGTVNLLAEAGSNYSANTTYTIINAAGGVSGTFNAVTLDLTSIFLTPSLSYDANNVYASIARNGTSFASSARTANQTAVANAIESLGGGNSLYDAIAMQSSASAASKAFKYLSGEIYADINDDLLYEQNELSQIIMNRNGEYKTASSTLQKSGELGSIWMQGYGFGGERTGDTAMDFSHNSSGIMLGADKFFAKNLSLGFSFGYGTSDYDVIEGDPLNDAKGDAKKYSLSFYGKQAFGDTNLQFGGGYTFADIDTSRNISFGTYQESLSSSYDAHGSQLFGEISHKLQLQERTFASPFASLSYAYNNVPSFSETGQAAALHAKDNDAWQGASIIGIKGKQILSSQNSGDDDMLLVGSVGWKHLIGDAAHDYKTSFSNSSQFNVKGPNFRREDIVTSLGLDLFAGDRSSLGLSYTAQPLSNSHSIHGGISYNF